MRAGGFRKQLQKHRTHLSRKEKFQLGIIVFANHPRLAHCTGAGSEKRPLVGGFVLGGRRRLPCPPVYLGPDKKNSLCCSVPVLRQGLQGVNLNKCQQRQGRPSREAQVVL